MTSFDTIFIGVESSEFKPENEQRERNFSDPGTEESSEDLVWFRIGGNNPKRSEINYLSKPIYVPTSLAKNILGYYTTQVTIEMLLEPQHQKTIRGTETRMNGIISRDQICRNLVLKMLQDTKRDYLIYYQPENAGSVWINKQGYSVVKTNGKIRYLISVDIALQKGNESWTIPGFIEISRDWINKTFKEYFHLCVDNLEIPFRAETFDDLEDIHQLKIVCFEG